MLSSLWLLALIIVLLIIASAFFSSAETALTAASDARMRQLASKGNERARTVEALRADREGLIGSILIGNNAVNVLGSALATSIAISLFGEGGLVWATIAMTVLLVVFAEVMPKTYAFTYADQYALRIAPTLLWVVRLLSPLSLGIRFLASQMIRPNPNGDQDREEELRGLIELQGDNGNADDRERKAMLSSILDLNELSVEQIMTHRGTVSMVNADDNIEDILRFVLGSPHTRHPVFSGKPDNIIGVLHVKDLLRALGEAESSGKKPLLPQLVQNIASDAYFIPETSLLFDQLQAFRTRREHFAVVVDEYGVLQGLVTLEDILEEIVGQIEDEHDFPTISLMSDINGNINVDGNVTLRDLNRKYNLNFPEEDVSTIAGLIINIAKRIPEKGESFIIKNKLVTIVSRNQTGITKILIKENS